MKFKSYYSRLNKNSCQRLVLISKLLILSTTLSFSGYGAATARFQSAEHLVQDTWKIAAGACHIEPITLTKDSKLYGTYFVQGAVDNRVSVVLLDDWNYGLWRSRQAYSQFEAMSGIVKGRANLKFVSPKSGQYYALFCNDKAFMLDRLVSVDLYRASTELTPGDEAFLGNLHKILAGVHQEFDLPDFDLSVEPCGLVNAFSNPNITICTEILNSFPRDKFSELFIFVLLHELGHTTLKLWNLPGADSEDTADEFAAALLLMGKKEGVVDVAAQWWLSKSGSLVDVKKEAINKINNDIDDRHSLSIQRAHNLHRWASDNGELVQRWATLLAPHFTDSALRDLAKDSRFFNNASIQSELARREDNGSMSTVPGPLEIEANKSATDTPLTKRLLDLKQAYESGPINEEEYKQQRSRVLRN